MTTRFNIIFLFIGVLIAVSACSPLRKAGKEEYLLVKNKIIQEGKYKDSDDLKNYILTKPNKKLLGVWTLRLQIYNLVNQDKMYSRRKYLDSLREAKNEKRLADGKKPNIKSRSTLRERFFKFGEPPALFSESENKRSVENMEMYLFNKGYFQGTVRDSSIKRKNRKSTVYFTVNRNQPYMLNEIKLEVSNEGLKKHIDEWEKQSLLKKGDKFDLEKMDEERNLLMRFLRKKGYYFFNKEFIEFEADTATGDHLVNVKMKVLDPDFNIKLGDSLVQITAHRPAEIRRVLIDTDYDPTEIRAFTDTLFYDKYGFPYREKLDIDVKVIAKQIILEPGYYYNTDDNDFTYRNFSNLRTFRNISIEFVYVGSDNGKDYLDCRILLTPAKKQSFGIDFQGTTTGAYPGLETNFFYRNRNAFQGAETFEFKVYVRAESQRVGNDPVFNANSLFNTLEIGNEIGIRIPKFLVPFKIDKQSKRNTPFTNIRVNNAYQTRPDYSRFISTFSFGYEWQETNLKFHRYVPLEFSVIRVQKTGEFEDIINASNDLFLRNSFSDHILFHNVYSYSYSNLKPNRPGRYLAIRFNAQLGGNLLYLIALAGKFQKDQSDRYTILNTPFAQFLRVEPDFRGYFIFNKTHSIAMRGLLGIGIPYLNSRSLPFEKSFSAGGATDIRGWRARRLGPGSFNQGTGFVFDQFADLKLLLQAEYRVTLIKQIELGIFADAGNIWLINNDPNRPGANFSAKRFYNEIALGAGVGIRINLGFFIFRVDPGIPLYDPTVVPVENKWIVKYLKWNSVVWNFAINYPF